MDDDNQDVEVTCKPCQVCHKVDVVKMPRSAYLAWQQGAHLQWAWPQGSAAEREQLISGTHGACWDLLFPPDEQDA